MQLYQNAIIDTETQDITAETAAVLELLAYALGIIALPGTPAALSMLLAIMAHNCAINWAALLQDGHHVIEGGAQ
ncbi:hypothetical protein [Pseudomonas sp. dw_358]|uniref:hypothetical protein n=1 Tax=Pseudomonas sp. dw_358 TaxID=2720083 RepID=UPI001BD24585|nr:hypothetical protein [Pseudomonas sp. dw_358]